MINILQKIAEHKKLEVSQSQQDKPISELRKMPMYQRTCLSATQAIATSATGIIAEFKKKSPSKPNINLEAKVETVVPDYKEYGAAAVSILTDKEFFGGELSLIEKVRTTKIPILRKDFIIDAYQIYEAKAAGADFILLIAALLTKEDIIHFTSVAHDIGLEVLLEFHAGEDFDKLIDEVDLVGINNRNLRTFEVNLNHAIQMRSLLPKDRLVIAESGIGSVEDYQLLKKNGFKGFLMGEYFMKNEQPGLALKDFIKNIQDEA